MSAGFVSSNVDVAAQDAQNAQRMTAGSTGTSNNDPSDFQNTSGTAVEGAADATSRAAGKAEDGISRFFSNLFGTDHQDTHAYTNATRSGRSVVTVHAASSEEAERARDIMDGNGAIDVRDQATAQGYGMTGTQGNAANTGTTQTATGQQTGSVPIIEENLQVGKRVEQTGGARIRSRIIEKPVEEHVRLREEHVNVQRRDVNRPATEADFAAFKEGEIKVTEQAERAVVSKEARVVGEVNIGKEVTERDETVRTTVRKTDVDVQQLGANDARTGNANMDNDNRTNR
ncbi:YsnF/AvaK domain-containing protein [Hymenobacter sp. BT770]|uniref:YsnF/AvaK domain-containing protein n=1 Tax=Hymenobacter sp. BT770 TaxID=2886942 RepID=UPI001D0F6E7E|nr:YsnF/AvaK domain-containing protein [Hymenobacter sp. BT770]MCC3152268.1 YsnF/AvaK domain-containing protein [Hymenobacter sp. BT770]MDO3414081.1 YsnF/AvaK domain-containing protein [Hymenobacter sp. BT770]